MENKIEIPEEIIVVKDAYNSLSKEKKSNLLSLLNDWTTTELNKLAFEEVEEELPKKGQVCWGSIADNLWRIGHFMCKDGDYFILSTQNDDRVDFAKHPKITTKNPYEVEEEDREPKVGDMCFFWNDIAPHKVICSILEDTKHPLFGDGFYILKGEDIDFYEHCSLKNPLIK